MWNSATTFGVKLLKSCKLFNLNLCLGWWWWFGCFMTKKCSSTFRLSLFFHQKHDILLCSIGIQQIHISKACGSWINKNGWFNLYFRSATSKSTSKIKSDLYECCKVKDHCNPKDKVFSKVVIRSRIIYISLWCEAVSAKTQQQSILIVYWMARGSLGSWKICLLLKLPDKLSVDVKATKQQVSFCSIAAVWDVMSVSYEWSPHCSCFSCRLLPLESVFIAIPSRIQLRLRRHELPHRAALLPGSHLHDWSTACRCAWRSG